MAFEISARGKILTNDNLRQYLHIDNESWWATELARFDPDTAVVVTIKKWYKKRTTKQNSLFHAYVAILADYFGYTPETMKELIRLKWLKVPLYDKNGEEAIDVTTGEVLFDLRSTKDLSTLEMVELCEAIRIWGEEGWNVRLPLPEENIKLNFK